MTRPSIIYCSGPITTGGNVPVNVRRGIEAATIIMDRGYVVICPHEKAFGMEMLSPRSYEDWMDYDYRCIEACDALYRMPEPSVGGDREVAYAQKIGRPVYWSYETLFAGVPLLQTVDRKWAYPTTPAKMCFSCGLLVLREADHVACRGAA